MIALEKFLQSPWVETLGWTLVHFLWQGVVIGAVAWPVLHLTRRMAPNARYVIACGFMAACVAAPVSTFLLLAKSHQETAPASVSTRGGSPQSPAITDANGTPVPAAQQTLVIQSPSPARTLRPSLSAFANKAAPWTVPFWLLGVVILQARLCLAWCGVQSWRMGAAPATGGDIAELFARIAQSILPGRRVLLLFSGAVPGPLTLGWLKPVILLPAQIATGLSRMEIEAVLAHELSHIRRYDYLANLLQSAVEIVLFYHPVVWWLGRNIRDIREECCDEEAARICPSRADYARALMALAELQFSAAPALAASGGSLFSRISRLLGRPKPEPVPGRSNAAWSLVLTGLLVIALVLLHSPKSIAGGNDSSSPSPTPKPKWSEKYGVLFGPEPGRIFGEIVDENGKPIPQADITKVVIHNTAHFAANNAGWAMDEEAQVEDNQFRGPNHIQFPPQSTTTAIYIEVLVKDRPQVLFKVPDLKAADHLRIVVPKESGAPQSGATPQPDTSSFYPGPGRVFGEIVDENGQPLPRADITKVLIHYALGPNGGMDGQAQIEDNQFRDPSPVQANSALKTTAISIGVLAKGRAPAFFNVPDIEAVSHLRIVVQKESEATIHVTSAVDGKPVEGVHIEGYYDGPPRLGEISAVTDAHGNASIPFSDSGPAFLAISAKGFVTGHLDTAHPDPLKPTPISLAKAQPVTGRVIEEETGKPLPNAAIKLAGMAGPFDGASHSESHGPDDAPLLATTDAQGAFTLDALDGKSDYHFFVESAERRAVVERPPHSPNAPMEIKLGKPVTVSGKILLPVTTTGKIRIEFTQWFEVQKGGFQGRQMSVNAPVDHGVARFQFEHVYTAGTYLRVFPKGTNPNEDYRDFLVSALPGMHFPSNNSTTVLDGPPDNLVVDLTAK